MGKHLMITQNDSFICNVIAKVLLIQFHII